MKLNKWTSGKKIVVLEIYAKFIDYSFVALLISCDKDPLFNSMSENKHQNDEKRKKSNDIETIECKMWKEKRKHDDSKRFIFILNGNWMVNSFQSKCRKLEWISMWMVVCMHDYSPIKIRRAINAKCEF